MIYTSELGRHSLAPRAKPPPTPRVPNAPGSSHNSGPRGLQNGTMYKIKIWLHNWIQFDEKPHLQIFKQIGQPVAFDSMFLFSLDAQVSFKRNSIDVVQKTYTVFFYKCGESNFAMGYNLWAIKHKSLQLLYAASLNFSHLNLGQSAVCFLRNQSRELQTHV